MDNRGFLLRRHRWGKHRELQIGFTSTNTLQLMSLPDCGNGDCVHLMHSHALRGSGLHLRQNWLIRIMLFWARLTRRYVHPLMASTSTMANRVTPVYSSRFSAAHTNEILLSKRPNNIVTKVSASSPTLQAEQYNATTIEHYMITPASRCLPKSAKPFSRWDYTLSKSKWWYPMDSISCWRASRQLYERRHHGGATRRCSQVFEGDDRRSQKRNLRWVIRLMGYTS